MIPRRRPVVERADPAGREVGTVPRLGGSIAVRHSGPAFTPGNLLVVNAIVAERFGLSDGESVTDETAWKIIAANAETALEVIRAHKAGAN